jgi:hypothetical protein
MPIDTQRPESVALTVRGTVEIVHAHRPCSLKLEHNPEEAIENTHLLPIELIQLFGA